MAQAPLAITIHHDIRNALQHCRLKLVAQRAVMNRTLFEFFACEFRRLTKSNDAGNVLRARAPLALLMSTHILSKETNTSANVKRTGAFRRIQLMRGERQQIATKLIHVQTQSPASLNRIRMKPEMSLARCPTLTHQPGDLSDRLNRSDLVVRHHDR